MADPTGSGSNGFRFGKTTLFVEKFIESGKALGRARSIAMSQAPQPRKGDKDYRFFRIF